MPFELQPTIRGELLELRPLLPEDFDTLYAVASDPLLWEQHPARDRYKEDVFRQLFRESLDSGSALIATDTAGNVIGSSRYYGYDENGSEIEIGWSFLARSYWGGTYNREMKRLMMAHAFRFVENVIFIVGPENHRSQRAMEKIGGKRFRTLTKQDGQVKIVFRITAGEFAAMHKLEKTDRLSL